MEKIDRFINRFSYTMCDNKRNDVVCARGGKQLFDVVSNYESALYMAKCREKRLLPPDETISSEMEGFVNNGYVNPDSKMKMMYYFGYNGEIDVPSDSDIFISGGSCSLRLSNYNVTRIIVCGGADVDITFAGAHNSTRAFVWGNSKLTLAKGQNIKSINIKTA